MGLHNHELVVSLQPGTDSQADQNYLAVAQDPGNPDSEVLSYLPYNNNAPSQQQVPLDIHTLGLSGSSVPHENRQPFLAITYIIATKGLFPSLQ